MAKVVVDEQQVIVKPWWDRSRIGMIGLAIGLGWWVLTALLRKYVIEPLACRDLSVANACIDSLSVAGDIAIVIITLLGIVALVRSFYHRPLLIAVASGAVLWGLGGFVAGLAWYESLLWAAFLFTASYTLFSLVARIKVLWLAVVVAVGIVVVIRLLLTF